MSSETPSITVRQILSEIWIPVLVTVMTVIAHDAVTGQSSGGAVIGAMIGVSIVMIRQSSAHPDISPTRRRLRLAAVTFAGTAAALVALHVYRYATGDKRASKAYGLARVRPPQAPLPEAMSARPSVASAIALCPTGSHGPEGCIESE